MFAEEYLLILFFKLFLNERIQKFTKKNPNKQKYQNKISMQSIQSVFSSFGFKYLIFKYSLLLGSSASFFKSQCHH